MIIVKDILINDDEILRAANIHVTGTFPKKHWGVKVFYKDGSVSEHEDMTTKDIYSAIVDKELMLK